MTDVFIYTKKLPLSNMSKQLITASTICALASISLTSAENSSSTSLPGINMSFDTSSSKYSAPTEQDLPQSPIIDTIVMYQIEGPRSQTPAYFPREEKNLFEKIEPCVKKIGSNNSTYHNNLKSHGVGHMRFGNKGNRYK